MLIITSRFFRGIFLRLGVSDCVIVNKKVDKRDVKGASIKQGAQTEERQREKAVLAG